MRWQSIDTAPHDRTILLDVGWICAVVGHFNSVGGQFVYAKLQIGMYDGDHSDAHFANEYERAPKGWQELPEIKTNAA